MNAATFAPGQFVIRSGVLANVIKRSKDKRTWMVRLQHGSIAWWPEAEMEAATERCPRCKQLVSQAHTKRQSCRNKEV